MDRYYSVFPEGFGDVVKEIVEGKGYELGDKGEGYITFDSKDKVDYRFSSSTFLLTEFFKEDYNAKSMTEWCIEHIDRVMEGLVTVLSGSSFRIVVSPDGGVDDHLINKLEIELEDRGIRFEKGEPDYEFRIVQKKDHGFVGVKVYSSVSDNSMNTEIAYYMNHMSGIDKSDVFLDPMEGSGTIPNLRKEMGEFKSITGFDIKTGADFLEYEGKANKIVFDPPWGYMEGIEDIVTFYTKVLDKCVEVAMKDAVVVILTPHIDIVEKYVEGNEGVKIDRVVEGMISGKKASIVRLVI